MSLLFEDKPLVINPKLAELIGLNEAIVIQQMSYWIKRSENIIDGKRWVYNSAPKWKKQFPFFSESTIKRAIYKLEELGLLFTGNYNKDGRDKTKWYSINYKAVSQLMNDASCQNERWNDQIDTMQDSNLTRPLPENTTEITTDINTRDKSLVVDDENIDQPEDDFEEEIKPITDQPKKPTRQNIPYQKIVELYEQILPELPVVNILNDTRKSHIRARWNEHPNHQSLEFWKDFFEYVRASDFLMGKAYPKDGGRPFRANIDWLLKPVNFAKVTEGNYV